MSAVERMAAAYAGEPVLLHEIAVKGTLETVALFGALSPERRHELAERFAAEVRAQAQLEVDDLAERADSLRAVLAGNGGSSLQPEPASTPTSETDRTTTQRRSTPRKPGPSDTDVIAAIRQLGGRSSRGELRRHFGFSQHSNGEKAIGVQLERLTVKGDLEQEGRVRGGGLAYEVPKGPGAGAVAAARERLDGARGAAARVAREGTGGAQAATDAPPDPDARRRAAITQHAAQSAAAAGDAAAESARARGVVPGATVGDYEERQRQLDADIRTALGEGPATVPEVVGRLKANGIHVPAATVVRRMQQLERDGDVAKSPPGIYRLEAA